MDQPLDIALALHLHLPPGSTEEEQQRAWKNCFEPILGALHHTPDVHCGLVLAGEVIENFQQRHPEGIEWIRELQERKQIELIATALHEPVLSAVPERDGTGQLAAHATLVKRVFGERPTGCWLPHGVWDPSTPRVMARAGLEWSLIPDRFLVDVGARGAVYGVYRTEREGMSLGLLPMETEAARMLTEVPVKQLFLRFRRRLQRGHTLLTLAASAGLFGLQAGRDPRSDQTWLATLFAGLVNARPNVRTLLPSDAVRNGPYRGRVYLPSAAPREIGVPWERHLARYDEANRLHKKMLRVSRMVNKLKVLVQQTAHSDVRPDPELLHQAHRYLYRAQAADVYWHGPHAGIYDAVQRSRAWRDVLRAERVSLQGLGTDRRVHVETVDLDCDGTDEVVMRTPEAIVVVDPARAGGVSELSLFAYATNLANTMTRMPEPYHQKREPLVDLEERAVTDVGEGERNSDPWMEDAPTQAAMGEGDDALTLLARDLKLGMSLDKRPRVSFVEHILGPDVTLSNLRRGNFAEMDQGLQDAVWDLVSAERHGDEALSCILTAGALVSDAVGARRAAFSKRYVLRTSRENQGIDRFSLEYKLEVANKSHEALRTRLAVELNLSLGTEPMSLVVPRGKGRERRDMSEAGEAGDVREISVQGTRFAVAIEVGKPARLWHYPIQTVYRHHGEAVASVQGLCLVFQWPLELWGKEKERVTIRYRIEEGVRT